MAKKKSEVESTKIKYKDLIAILKKGEGTQLFFQDYYDSLEISSYINSETQYMVAEHVISNNPLIAETEGVEKIKAIELAKVFNILLSYIVNLEVDFDDINFTNLDIMEKVGFIDLLKSKVNNNYILYCKRLDEILNQNAISQTKELLETLTKALQELGEDMAKETEAFKSNMEKMSPEMLEKIHDIAEFNDPLTKQLNEFIKTEAEKDMGKDKEELLRQLEEMKGMPFDKAFLNNPELAIKTLKDATSNAQTKNFVNKKKK